MQTVGSLVSNIRNIPKLPRLGVIRLGLKNKQGQAYAVEYFIIDAESPSIERKALQVYGERPTELRISFYTDIVDEIFQCKLQRWGQSENGTPYLLCEGNGCIAIERGNREQRTCPCSHLNRSCRKKTILRFLIPSVSMGGYFTLVTKSENNARMIETAITILRRDSRGLIMRPLKLIRSEGHVPVKDFKVKKHFVHLIPDEDAPVAAERAVLETETAALPAEPKALIAGEDISWLVPGEEMCDKLKVEDRCRNGRQKVKEKIKVFIRDPRALRAIEIYASRRFKKESFDLLSLEELLHLHHDIGERALISEVLSLIQELAE